MRHVEPNATDIHPLTHIRTLRNAHSRTPHPSSGGFWQLFMLLNWLSHYSWNISSLRESERESPAAFSRKNRKKQKDLRKKRRAEGRLYKICVKCSCTPFLGIIYAFHFFFYKHKNGLDLSLHISLDYF